MNHSRFRHMAATFITAALALGMTSRPASAQDRPCSLEYLAGDWVFYTDVGRQNLIPDEGDITAIGKQSIGADGALSGVFDVTFENSMHIPDIPFNGSIEVGADCRGTVNFVTGTGTSRADSIVVVSENEIRGMSRDINNLWTYTVRRINRNPAPPDQSAKINAIMRRLGLVPQAFE